MGTGTAFTWVCGPRAHLNALNGVTAYDWLRYWNNVLDDVLDDVVLEALVQVLLVVLHVRTGWADDLLAVPPGDTGAPPSYGRCTETLLYTRPATCCTPRSLLTTGRPGSGIGR